jgi:hypothetical protein
MLAKAAGTAKHLKASLCVALRLGVCKFVFKRAFSCAEFKSASASLLSNSMFVVTPIVADPKPEHTYYLPNAIRHFSLVQSQYHYGAILG